MFPVSARVWAMSVLLAAACGCVEEHCYADRDCTDNRICDRGQGSPTFGRCVYQCSADADCPSAAHVCRDHRCVLRQVPPLTCPEDMVAVGDAFCIDRYEASRPDATETAAGVDDSRATSREGVLPWQVPDNAAAAQACAAAGKRLCAPDEWETACRGPAGTSYGYGDDYDPLACNGIDTFGTSGFHLLPTGSLSTCQSGYGAFDLNGNLWEHVAGGTDMTVRGGAYNCSDSRTYHLCSYVPGNWKPAARGFRCCSAGVPPDAGVADAPAGDGGEGGCLDEDGGVDAAAPDAPGDAEAAGDAADAATLGPCPPEMVLVDGVFCIDRYEASRPDATQTSAGTSTTRATSRAGVLPWQPVTLADGRAACAAAGKRLCRAEEWLRTCEGPQPTVYSYGDAYDPTTCNGIDAYCTCGSGVCATVTPCPFPHCYQQCGAAFHVMPTGSFAGCHSADGVYDVNGNVWEIVDSDDGLEHFRGGAYNCSDSEALHRCDHDATWGPSARGFRCCRDPRHDG